MWSNNQFLSNKANDFSKWKLQSKRTEQFSFLLCNSQTILYYGKCPETCLIATALTYVYIICYTLLWYEFFFFKFCIRKCPLFSDFMFRLNFQTNYYAIVLDNNNLDGQMHQTQPKTEQMKQSSQITRDSDSEDSKMNIWPKEKKEKSMSYTRCDNFLWNSCIWMHIWCDRRLFHELDIASVSNELSCLNYICLTQIHTNKLLLSFSFSHQTDAKEISVQ